MIASLNFGPGEHYTWPTSLSRFGKTHEDPIPLAVGKHSLRVILLDNNYNGGLHQNIDGYENGALAISKTIEFTIERS